MRLRRRQEPDDSAPAPPETSEPPGQSSPSGWASTRLFPAEAKLPMPPAELQNQVGPPGVFADVGLTTMGRLNMAGLCPDHDVLDVGCGVGRTARYLCDYLEPTSRYEGFDVMEGLIGWCQDHITPSFPNFGFLHVPVHNSAYQPDRSLPSAGDLTFPYEDNSFDFVFAHSVFTHLAPEAAANYLRETHRVLRPGGISYATWFLYDGELATNPSPLIAGMTPDPSGDFALHDPSVPETAVGYRERYVLDLYVTCRLSLAQPVRRGFKKLQDAIVATR